MSGASKLKAFHFTMMVIWAVLIVPTVIWWKDSILWLGIMSVWANFAGHFAAYEGARAEKKSEDG